MRPLRFRAWNPETKQYDPCWYPLPGDIGDNGELELDGFYDNGTGDPGDPGNEQLIEDGAVIEQWTGLKDKNGKDIYEGDILDYFVVLYEDNRAELPLAPRLVVVEWANAAWGYRHLYPELLHEDTPEWEAFWCPDDGEVVRSDFLTVIGNIHDNLELLEGSHAD